MRVSLSRKANSEALPLELALLLGSALLLTLLLGSALPLGKALLLESAMLLGSALLLGKALLLGNALLLSKADEKEIRWDVMVSAFDDVNGDGVLTYSHDFVIDKQKLGNFADNVFREKEQSTNLLKYGRRLFNILFKEKSLASEQLEALLLFNKPQVLLELNGEQDLDDILWEYMNSPKEPLVRQLMFTRVLKREPPKCFLTRILKREPPKCFPLGPLRIVMAAPDPIDIDNKIADLHLGDQRQNFIDKYHRIKRQVTLECVYPPTVETMKGLLPRDGKPTALHFMGHCTNSDTVRTLIFEGENGEIQRTNTNQLFDIPENLRLAYLSACNTREIAQKMMEHGVPYTIGSCFSIPNDIACMFEIKFYEYLANGYSVDEAMWRTRVAISDDKDYRQIYCLPGALILYSSALRENSRPFQCAEGDPEVDTHIPPNNLPITISKFCGRKKELLDLYDRLRTMATKGSQDCHLYTITGIGGQGKTTLAMEAVNRAGHFFPGGIFAWRFNDDEKISAANYLWSLLEFLDPKGDFKALRNENDDDQRRELKKALIREFKKGASRLLILDHADTLIRQTQENEAPKALHELVQFFKDILESKSAVKILATSHKRLTWPSEKHMKLEGFINSNIGIGEELFSRSFDAEMLEKMEEAEKKEKTRNSEILEKMRGLINGNYELKQLVGDLDAEMLEKMRGLINGNDKLKKLVGDLDAKMLRKMRGLMNGNDKLKKLVRDLDTEMLEKMRGLINGNDELKKLVGDLNVEMLEKMRGLKNGNDTLKKLVGDLNAEMLEKMRGLKNDNDELKKLVEDLDAEILEKMRRPKNDNDELKKLAGDLDTEMLKKIRGLIDGDDELKKLFGDLNAEIPETIRLNINDELKKLVGDLDGHPLSLVLLARVASFKKNSYNSLLEIVHQHRTLLAESKDLPKNNRIAKSLEDCFNPVIAALTYQQRLILYICSLFTKPIEEQTIRELLNNDILSIESSKVNHSEIHNDLEQLYDDELLVVKFDNKYRIHVAVRDVVKWYTKFKTDDERMLVDDERMLLHRAAKYGRVQVVQSLLDEPYNLYAKDENGRTPLHLAAQNGHVEVMESLLRKSHAEVNAKDNYGWTPLHAAAEMGHDDVMELLVTECNADVNAKDNYGWTPLHLAAQNKHVTMVESLVSKFGAKNAKDNYGWTPLHSALHSATQGTALDSAARNNQLQVVKSLLSEVSTKDSYGCTPLHVAAQNGNLLMIELLMSEVSADANVKKNNGWTPLHSAAENGHDKVVKSLVREYGGDKNAKDNYGWTPLHLAAQNGHYDVVKSLVTEFNADVNAKKNDGWTPLHSAAQNEHREVEKFLMSKGANVDARNNFGKKSFDLAVQKGHEDVGRLFK